MTDPIVETTAGAVRGVWRDDASGGRSAAFLGIPFAEPPIGPLRFQAPVPHAPWSEVRDAVEHGATPQRRPFADVTSIPEPTIPGESTLNVNVFTPDPAGPTPLPVLVWIHGGGFIAGSPASPWYDGSAFARDGVVTVVVSYRLGFDGFGWIADAPSNRGVRDWLLALEWVQQNVAAFGGDPGRVTIGGQSAGGGAVLDLLGMEQAQHLFHAALAISPGGGSVPAVRAEAVARRMADLTGVTPDRAGFATVADEDLRDLFETAARDGDGAPRLADLIAANPAGPMIDGDLLPRPALESIRQGVGADKPLVIGTTDDEFTGALDGVRDVLRFIPVRLVLRRLGVSAASRDRYLAANLDVRRRGVAATVGRFVTDTVFRAPTVEVLEARAEAAASIPSIPSADSWLYRFAWRSPVSGIAGHCLDVPFWFDCLAESHVPAEAGPAAPQPLADEMHGRAAALVTAGDPGWPAWHPESRVERVFDAHSVDGEGGYAGATALL